MVRLDLQPHHRRGSQRLCVLSTIPLHPNRSTATTFFSVLYGFSLAYLVAPGSFDSAHVVEFVAGLPDAVKYAGKALLALPFTFHSFNGLRHLAWDMGKCTSHSTAVMLMLNITRAVITLKGAYSSGYAVLGATAISTVALVLM